MQVKLFTISVAIFVSQVCLGQLKIEDLKVDTSITGFRYSGNFQGTHVFTPNGSPDINTINPSAFSFTVMSNATYEDALVQITYLLKMSLENGYTHTDIIKVDTTINGLKVYYTSMTETKKSENYKNLIFHGFYIKDKTAILFISGDLDNGKYIEKFKQTFYTLNP